jgi:TolB-like protein
MTKQSPNLSKSVINKIISSPVFNKAKRQRELLLYLIDHLMTQNTGRIKGYVIATEVFKKSADFDPTIDAIVRVEVSRLRNKLREYYDTHGKDDDIEIYLPKGSYVLELINRSDGVANTLLQKNKGRISNPKLAVMPFLGLSKSDKNYAFIENIADNIIYELIDLPSINVISRQNSFSHSSALAPLELSNELGAEYLLEGAIQDEHDALKVMARLFSAREDRYIWTEKFLVKPEETKDFFNSLSRHIHKKLLDEMLPVDAEMYGIKDTQEPSAQTLLMEGMDHFWKYTAKHLEIAKKCFSKALSIDPGYYCAASWLARTYIYELILQFHDGITDGNSKIEAADYFSNKAIKINPEAPFSLAIHGWVSLWKKDLKNAVKYARRAVSNDPDNTEALTFLSLILCSLGAKDEAIIFAEKMKSLHPNPGHINLYVLGMANFINEDFETAIDYFALGCKSNPALVHNHLYQCLAHTQLNQQDKANQKKSEIMCMLGGDLSKLPKSQFQDEGLYRFVLDLREKAGLTQDELQ